MISIVPASSSRRHKRVSLLMASSLTRIAVALAAVLAIWLGTAWALGWV